ncbi:hypothetical protein LCGC14_3005680 [marine sediment metagenome]|uniref:DUF4325 domain-containing protein n=1 Tax=marine sediment metagenome TaxID=412755 RepID=A0A0F8WZK2_9ZZZZ
MNDLSTIPLRKALGTDLSSRGCAAALRTRILQAVESGTPRVVIDVTGVRSMSESFADELFAVLAERKGEKWFRQHIELQNLTTELRWSILSAISGRAVSP